MAYKVENGKVYEIREIDVSEIEKEVKQKVAFIKQYTEARKPYLNAIAQKEAEKKAAMEKFDREIASYQLVADEHSKKIVEAQAGLVEKKEIIVSLYPEHKEILGF